MCGPPAVLRMELDKRLGAYPLDKLAEWQLASHIAPPVVGPCCTALDDTLAQFETMPPKMNYSLIPRLPRRRGAAAATTTTTATTTATATASAAAAAGAAAASAAADADAAGAASMHERHTAAELTALHMDRTWLLEAVAAASYNKSTPASLRFFMNMSLTGAGLCGLMRLGMLCVLGELQAAFIAFLFGEDVAALEQWKALVAAFCCAESATARYPGVVLAFVGALRFLLCCACYAYDVFF